MTSSLGSPQHYIECDNCEENPAKYICKTCPGNLCENCKTEHENRKITKDHEVTDFKTGNKDFDCYLFCPDHKSKKLECFCDSCKKPVCTECIVLFHNGHAVQSISAAYKEIRNEQVRQITKIEEELRSCKDVLQREEQKELDLAKKADEIEKQIMKHTSNVVEMVNEISKRNVQELRAMEQKGRNEINKSVDVIRRNVQKLTQTKAKLSANIETKPEVSFFQKQNSDLLDKVKEDMEEPFTNLTKYELDDFHPGKICDIIPTCFGTLPILRKIQPPPPRPPPPPPPLSLQPFQHPPQSLGTLYDRMKNASSPPPRQQQPTKPQTGFGKTPSITTRFGGTSSGFTFGATTKQASSVKGPFGLPSNMQHDSLFENSRTSSQTTAFGGTPSGFISDATTKQAISVKGPFGLPSNMQDNSLFENSRTSSQTTAFGGTPSVFISDATTKQASSVKGPFGLPSNMQDNSLFENSITSSQTTAFGGTPSVFISDATTKQASSVKGPFGLPSNMQCDSLFGNSRTSSQTTAFGGTPSVFISDATTKQASSGKGIFCGPSNMQDNSLFGNSRSPSQTTGFDGTPSGFISDATTKQASSGKGFFCGPSNMQDNSLFGNSRTPSQTTGFDGTPSGFISDATTKQASSGKGIFCGPSNMQHNSLSGNSRSPSQTTGFGGTPRGHSLFGYSSSTEF